MAFEKARLAVCSETEPGNLDTGLGARVQKFELDVDPKDASLVSQTTYRLLHHPGAPRCRLAAGTPICLKSTTLHDVPTLPAHYMPRPEQWELRAALVNGVRGDGTVVGTAAEKPAHRPPSPTTPNQPVTQNDTRRTRITYQPNGTCQSHA